MMTKRYYLGFLWNAQRKDRVEKFGISLNFNEASGEVEIASIAELSLAAEQNHNLSMNPRTRDYVLKTGDVVEAVNWQNSVDEILEELRTALSVEIRVRRTEYQYVWQRRSQGKREGSGLRHDRVHVPSQAQKR